MVKYARKSSIVDVEFPQEDGIVVTSSGDIPYYVGDVITRNRYGDREVFTRNTFDEFFTPVELVEKRPQSRLSPFEEEYIKACNEWNGAELSSEEDKEYIKEMMNGVYK